ncbi:hypothetical protein TorRG33x02_217510 [Trema orientale]|uniref:Uncharacterized protein n=1 Tax=Trema orientale TaxID=63057 RepID=A0A2P5EAE7_TREOI|nr:hypothetical protein TorRG33x02_217510 [Trema orientale]
MPSTLIPPPGLSEVTSGPSNKKKKAQPYLIPRISYDGWANRGPTDHAVSNEGRKSSVLEEFTNFGLDVNSKELLFSVGSTEENNTNLEHLPSKELQPRGVRKKSVAQRKPVASVVSLQSKRDSRSGVIFALLVI